MFNPPVRVASEAFDTPRARAPESTVREIDIHANIHLVHEQNSSALIACLEIFAMLCLALLVAL